MIATTHIAHRGKAGGQRPTSVLGHAEDPKSRRIWVAYAGIGKPLIRQVDVTVDEPGQDRRSSEMEPFGVWWWREMRTHPDDPIALEQQRARAHRRRAGPVDERVRGNEQGHVTEG